METIRVNMTPNPSDIQTIHCSQGDTEAREWEFELHNNGEVIDAGEITEQMVFKAYKGGTEQILPENGSVPTTAPFKGDIKYPDATRTDQEFIYRQSPTESDGNAKIQAIYGNTLKWNQLIDVGTDSTVERNGITFTVKSTGEVIANGTATAEAVLNVGTTTNVANHKMFIKGCPSGGSLTTYRLKDGYGNQNDFGNGVIGQSTSTNITAQIRIASGYTATNLTFIPQFFDLTMLGIDNLTLDEVKQWFADYYPLPYYQYDSGSLLPYRGNGIKTVGKNQLDPSVLNDLTTWQYVQISLMPNTTYVCSSNSPNTNGTNAPQLFALGKKENGDRESADIYTVVYDGHPRAVTTDKDGHLTLQFRTRTDGAITDYNWQIEKGTTPSSYEPYTSSTLSLPISTYFPTGMKSAGSVYDELTETKAITRVGMVDLGTLDYEYISKSQQFRSTTVLQDAKLPSSSSVMPNAKSALYNVMDYVTMINSDMSLTIIFSGSAVQGHVWIKNSNYTDVTAFKTAMSGVYLYYELATPTETSFTTASLVTENGEVALANENGVLVGKCNSDVSAEAGFIEGKIKLSDEDGDVYSNKIQIHVERSPQ